MTSISIDRPLLCYFDLESTGLDTAEARITEIAVQFEERSSSLLIDAHRDGWDNLVNPGICIPQTASKVNGITDEIVKDCPGTEIQLNKFFCFLASLRSYLNRQSVLLIAHNGFEYDAMVLVNECKRNKVEIPDWIYIADSMWTHLKIYPEYKGSVSLAALGEHYKVFGHDEKQTHRARGDVLLLQKVILAGSEKEQFFDELIKSKAQLNGYDWETKEKLNHTEAIEKRKAEWREREERRRRRVAWIGGMEYKKCANYDVCRIIAPDSVLISHSGHCISCDMFKFSHARYPVEGDCWACGKKLVPIGHARENGKDHSDWETRKYHKKCWNEHMRD